MPPEPTPELTALLHDAIADPAALSGVAFLNLEIRLFEYARDLIFSDYPPNAVVETIRVLLMPVHKRAWELGMDDRMLRARTASLLAALRPEGTRRTFAQPGTEPDRSVS